MFQNPHRSHLLDTLMLLKSKKCLSSSTVKYQRNNLKLNASMVLKKLVLQPYMKLVGTSF